MDARRATIETHEATAARGSSTSVSRLSAHGVGRGRVAARQARHRGHPRARARRARRWRCRRTRRALATQRGEAGLELQTVSPTLRRIGLREGDAAVALPPGFGRGHRAAAPSARPPRCSRAEREAVGARGSRMIVPPAADSASAAGQLRDALALMNAMESGAVGVLLVHDANPVYSLPASAGFAEALDKVGFVVSFATAATRPRPRPLVLPATRRSRLGRYSPRPGVRGLDRSRRSPLYDTQAVGETLLADRAARSATTSRRACRRAASAGVLEAAWADTNLRAALKRGGVFRRDPATRRDPTPRASVVPSSSRAPADRRRRLRLLAFPHPCSVTVRRRPAAGCRRCPIRSPLSPGTAGPRSVSRPPRRLGVEIRRRALRSRRRRARSRWRSIRAAAFATTSSRFRSGRATRSATYASKAEARACRGSLAA